MGLLSQALKEGNLVVETETSKVIEEVTIEDNNSDIEIAFPAHYCVETDDGDKEFTIFDDKYSMYSDATVQHINVKGFGQVVTDIVVSFIEKWSSWLGKITNSFIEGIIEENTLWEAQELFLQRMMELFLNHSPLRKGTDGKVVIDTRLIVTFKILPPPLKDWIPVSDVNPLEDLFQAQLNSNTLQSIRIY